MGNLSTVTTWDTFLNVEKFMSDEITQLGIPIMTLVFAGIAAVCSLIFTYTYLSGNRGLKVTILWKNSIYVIADRRVLLPIRIYNRGKQTADRVSLHVLLPLQLKIPNPNEFVGFFKVMIQKIMMPYPATSGSTIEREFHDLIPEILEQTSHFTAAHIDYGLIQSKIGKFAFVIAKSPSKSQTLEIPFNASATNMRNVKGKLKIRVAKKQNSFYYSNRFDLLIPKEFLDKFIKEELKRKVVSKELELTEMSP